jgi:hypothetical protein
MRPDRSDRGPAVSTVPSVRPARPYFLDEADIEAVIGIGRGRLSSPAARIYHDVVVWFADERRADA